MNDKLRRTGTVALEWLAIWAAFWAMLFLALYIVDPASIDPGEGRGALLILGSMGLLTSLAFGGLLSLGVTDGVPRPSLARVLVRGTVASGLVQVAYLGHGNRGVVANLGVALVFCAAGALVTIAWFVVAAKRTPGLGSVAAGPGAPGPRGHRVQSGSPTASPSSGAPR